MASPRLEREQQERRGQEAQSISVELVPDPDKTAKTQKWREGAQAQAPTPAPPQPQQTASLPQPEVQAQPTEEQPTKEEPTKDEPTKEEKQAKGGEPSIPDLEALVDAAADDLTEKIKRHYEQKPQKAQPERQAMYSGGGMQVRGTGASGKSDEFSKSVIAALMKTRPGPFALWGRVLVSFQITQQGDLQLRSPAALERQLGARPGGDRGDPQGAFPGPAAGLEPRGSAPTSSITSSAERPARAADARRDRVARATTLKLQNRSIVRPRNGSFARRERCACRLWRVPR